jgi:hypothetical protein
LLKALGRANRAVNKANKVLSPPRDLQLPILQRILEVLRERQQTALETTGNMGRGLLKSISREQSKHFPWLARHMVNHYIATHPYGQRIGTVVVTNSNNEKAVLGLKYSSPVARAMRADAVGACNRRLHRLVSASPRQRQLISHPKGGGLPQGSILGASNARKTLVADALDECAIEIASLKYTAASNSDRLGKKCRVPRGSYEKAVGKVCKKYDLERIELSM